MSDKPGATDASPSMEEAIRIAEGACERYVRWYDSGPSHEAGAIAYDMVSCLRVLLAASKSAASETARIDPWPDLDTAERDFTFGELWILGSQYADLLSAAPQGVKPLGAEVNLPAGAAPSSLVSAGGVGIITAEPITTHEELEAAYQQATRGRHISEIPPLLALRNLGLDALSARSSGAATPGAYRWIDGAVKALKEALRLTGKMTMGEQWCGDVDALLSGVPTPPQDLGFDSPADRYARAWHALNSPQPSVQNAEALALADERFAELQRGQAIIDRLKAAREKVLTRRCTNPKPVGDSACECCTHHWYALGEGDKPSAAPAVEHTNAPQAGGTYQPGSKSASEGSPAVASTRLLPDR